ncbi:MAG TPA: efflux RND transporter periplasmic adaptor subunit [Chthoniobacterales bacterium]|nr:efflux RND transporter periplasmic adaptor subunit [Chthoniobacterales bacterium]
MKTRFYRIFMILGIAMGLLALSGCSKPAAKPVADNDIDYWTCTMHPSVHSKVPGKCPICSMDLVPVKKKTAPMAATKTMSNGSMGDMNMGPSAKSSSESTEFTVPVERQQQIGVTYATVRKRPIELSIRSVGILESDPSQSFDYVARVDCYVQELKISSPGQEVLQGQPLLTIYSPDLRSTEQELVNLLNDRDRGGGRGSNDQLVEASKRRLKLWNVSDQEIAELEKSRKPSDQLILRSPFDGVVSEVMGRPGMSVKTGDKLASVLDLSHLWVWAEFYENEIELLKPGQTIDVSLPAFSNQTFQGKIAVINPMIDAVKRTTRVRIDLPNPKGQLRPGMYANVEVKIDDGEGLTIPVQAALPTGERMLVFLDRGEGKLLPRYVRVARSFTTFDGQEQGSYYQVVNGLQEGDRIVASANFLIDAESQVQGALKDFQEPEPSATPARRMHAEMDPARAALSQLGRKLYEDLLVSYSALRAELAADSLSGAQDSANTFLVQLRAIHEQLLDHVPDPTAYDEALDSLYELVQKFHPSTLDEGRVQFGQISDKLIAMLTIYPDPLDGSWNVVQCPMWKQSPARWIQNGQEIKNPFFGKAMPECGQIQGQLKSGQ